MRFESWLLEVSGTPLYLLLLFLFFLLAMHVTLVWTTRLSDRTWKKIDYVWLSAAVLGLVASSGEAGRFLSQSYLENLEAPKTAASYRYLRSQIERGAGSDGFLCMGRARSAMSPPDFDRIVEAQQDLCSWSKDTLTKMHSTVEPPFAALEETGYVPIPVTHKRYEPWYIAEVQKLAEDYRTNRNSYNERAIAAQMSLFDQLLTVLGPIVIAFALALRLTKVSGELANEKLKRAGEAQNAQQGDAGLTNVLGEVPIQKKEQADEPESTREIEAGLPKPIEVAERSDNGKVVASAPDGSRETPGLRR